MGNSKNDEAYRDGVEAGQNDDALQEFAYRISRGNSDLDEIYNKGYEYGRSHKNDDDD